MHLDAAVSKLRPNSSGLAKKNTVFWTTFSVIDP